MDEDLGKAIVPEKRLAIKPSLDDTKSTESDDSNNGKKMHVKKTPISAQNIKVKKTANKRSSKKPQLANESNELSIVKVVEKKKTSKPATNDEVSVVKVVKKKVATRKPQSSSDSDEVAVTKVIKKKTTKSKNKNTSGSGSSPPRSPSEIVSFDHSYCSPAEEESPDGKTKKKISKKPPKATTSKKKQVPVKANKPKTRKATVSTDESSTLKQSSITEHFQSKRSGRQRPSYLKKQLQLNIETKILNGDEEGLEVREVEGKGRAVFATRHFTKGELVCEYYGELLSYSVAKEKEKKYSLTPDVGCYMYFFEFKGKKYCVDSTAESDRLGRLLNHSKTKSNVSTRIFPIKDVPHLILVAARDIDIGEEFLYDYGDRNKESIQSHPWLLS